ncbi:cytochrome P450 [Amycolatopsis sp. NBRC 101858]|uniref:cytochrome P450 n=1 Tax=Amycolatopsis sp. NBRC 101858 TaxID=3032200 RepID=UPI00249FFA64|nr:cytochrome P450 [Amycolatopsis sp. NBRC 101858]GLY43856.1 cytochrome P450 [Amycolatopsis sp. NBRC 101858]
MDTTALPHRPGRLPVIGDLIGANPRTPLQDTLRIGKRIGPIFTRKIFGFEIVFVGGVDLVTELNDETKFGKHVGMGIENLRALAGDGLFTAHTHEPNWRLAHDILQPAFSAEAMRRYHPVMLDVARELVARWDAASGPVDVAADMTRLTLETIGLAGFGYRFGSFERSEPHLFVTAMIRALRYAQLQNVKLPFVRRAFAGTAEQNQADIATMTNLVDEVIDERRRSGAESRDLLGLMLSEGHPVTGERLDPVNIRNQAITFVVAGHETTSGALSFALYYLTRHPELLAKARAEVDAVWGDREPAFGDVAKLRYVRRCLDEAMRLWPTAPGYSREAREDVVLGGKYRMREGDWVIVPLPLVHRDPAVWPDPERFDPDRFEPAAVKKRPAQAYKPFGTGERACIGRQFALHEAVLALGMVLQRYDFEVDPSYELEIVESLTLKPSGFTLRPRVRTREPLTT